MLGLEIIGGVLILCMGYYVGFTAWATWHFMTSGCAPQEDALPTLSILVPARNEAHTIGALLQDLARQSYPEGLLEILVVNDHSEDATPTVVSKYCEEIPHLRIFTAKGSGKKAALATAISQAKGELILQTDADCRVPPIWAYTMARQFTPSTAMVSGPIYLDPQHTFFGNLQSLESLGLVALGGGAMNGGNPNMCNGANLAFRKSVFEAVKGYQGIEGVASGDDELLMQKFAALEGWELRFAKCREAIVKTAVLTNWHSFRSQRLRWVSKVRAYPRKSINVTQALFYLAFWNFPFWIIWALWDSMALYILGIVFMMKFAIDGLILCASAVFFRRLQALSYLPIMQPLYIMYVLWIGIAGNMIKRYNWKGRNVS